MTEQQENLERVRSKIAGAILSFRRGREMFYIQELHDYVAERYPVAPASADRVLRALRRDGYLNYQVINRANSYYRFIS